MGDYRPVLTVIGRLGPLASKMGERDPVNSLPPGGVKRRVDPAPIGPTAQRIAADPKQVRGFLDPKRRHHVTLTQMRLQSV